MTSQDTPPRVPTPDEIPLLIAAMSAARRVRFAAALKTLRERVSDGEIPNARYKDLRLAVIRGIEEGWSTGRMKLIDGIDRENPHYRQVWRATDMSGMADLLFVERRLLALKATGPEGAAAVAVDGALALRSEMAGVFAAVNWLRDRARKRAAPGSVPPAPVLPQATREAVALVEGIMRRTMDGLREGFIGEVAKICVQSAGEATTLVREMSALRERIRARDRAGEPRDAKEDASYKARNLLLQSTMYFAEPAVAVDYNALTVAPRPEAAVLTRRFAEREADQVLALCIARNVGKLAPTVEAMGGAEIEVRRAEVAYHGVEADFAVRFAEGGSLSLTNRVEVARSPLGRWFNRFPARYHDVVMPDGTRLKAPSEEIVKKTFDAVSEARRRGPDADEGSASRGMGR